MSRQWMTQQQAPLCPPDSPDHPDYPGGCIPGIVLEDSGSVLTMAPPGGLPVPDTPDSDPWRLLAEMDNPANDMYDSTTDIV